MKRLLLVDDHPIVRRGIAAVLQRLTEPTEVIPASSCEEAFAILMKDAEFDLVLMDLLLPGLPGSEGIRKIRADYPKLPVVALSVRSDSKTIRDTLNDGAMGFIPKTHSDDVLLGALELVIVRKGIYLPPEALSDDVVYVHDVQAPVVSENLTTPESIGLTPRQADVLYLLLKGGYSNKEIARELVPPIDDDTVKRHMNDVLKALKVTNRTQAVIAAYRMKLVFGEGPGARIKYTCSGCSVAAWGKGGLKLICGACNRSMPGDDEGDENDKKS